MQNTTETIKVPFQGDWDNGDVLTGYKKLREEMIKAGANTNLFKDFDKYISQSESLLLELTAEEEKGFDTTNIDHFTKRVEKLNSTYAVMQNIVESISKKTDFRSNAEQISLLTQKSKTQLALTRYKTDLARTEILNSQTAKAILNDKERAMVGDAIKKGDISEAIKKALTEVKNNRTAEILNYGNTLANSNAAKNYFSGTNNYANTLSDIDFDFGTSNATLEDVKAKYIEVLRNAIIYGKNANEAEQDLAKALEELGISINDEEEMTDTLRLDIPGVLSEIGSNGTSKQLETINKYIGAINTANNFDVEANAQRLTLLGDVDSAIKSQLELYKTQAELKETQEGNEDVLEGINELIRQQGEAAHQTASAMQLGCIATKEAALANKELEQSFNDVEQRLRQVLSLTTAFQGIRQVINQTFQDIQELDASFGSIAMVTDKSVSDLWDSYNQYADMASDLGQSTKDTIAASALFYQQGLDTADALSLTTDSMKLATLSGEDFEKSTSEMTAALRAFHMEMDEGSTITDVYSELAANAAADVSGIAYAMSKTASIANSAGMEFETTAAFLTLMIETTQEAPSIKFPNN